MPATPATKQLEGAHIPFRSHEYSHDASAVAQGLAYGEEAAAMLGVEAERIFKTLLVEVDGRPGVVIVPALSRALLKAVAAALKAKKATLMDPRRAEKLTGYVVGGISPLGQKRQLPTVLDDSALAHDSIFVSGGRRGFDIEISPNDLVKALQAVTAPLTMTTRSDQERR